MESFKWFIFILIGAAAAFGTLYFLDCREEQCRITSEEEYINKEATRLANDMIEMADKLSIPKEGDDTDNNTKIEPSI